MPPELESGASEDRARCGGRVGVDLQGAPGYRCVMTTAPFEPGSDPAVNPGDDPSSPDPIAPGEDPGVDPSDPQPTES